MQSIFHRAFAGDYLVIDYRGFSANYSGVCRVLAREVQRGRGGCTYLVVEFVDGKKIKFVNKVVDRFCVLRYATGFEQRDYLRQKGVGNSPPYTHTPHNPPPRPQYSYTPPQSVAVTVFLKAACKDEEVLKKLRAAAILNTHPDRGGSQESFVLAMRGYEEFKKLIGR